MDETIEKVTQFSYDNPRYIYLLIAVLGLVFLLGFIKNKNWAIDPANTNQRLFYQWFGRKAFRVVGLAVCCVAILSGLLGFLLN